MKNLYTPTTFNFRRPFATVMSATFSPENTTPPLSPPPQITHLNSILTHIKSLSKNPKCYQSLTTLDSLLAKTHLFKPSTSLIIIDFLSQINKLSRGKMVIAHLYSKGSLKDSFLYSLVFEFIAKDGGLNDVENAWQEICGSQKSDNFYKSFCTKYVILVCEYGCFDEIKVVYERVLLGGGEVLGWEGYVALCARLCDLNEGLLAKRVVEVMCGKGMLVDDWVWFSMFECFCRTGSFDEADSVLRRLVKNGFAVDVRVYGSFLSGLCKAGKYREASKLFRKMLKRVPVGGFEKREVVLREGRRAIFQLRCEGVVPEMTVYECYFRALCNSRKLDEAEVLLKKMLSGSVLPEICVYGSFIEALFRAGRDDDAMKFFRIQRKKGLVRVDEIGRHVIMALCEKRQGDDALSLFEDIKMTNGFVNSSDVCNSILDSYWKQSSVAKAEIFFENWRLNEDNYGKTNVMTYTIMLTGYCNHSDISKAVLVFEEMLKNKMVVNGILYERIIRLLCECGQVNEAFLYLDESIENGHFLFCKRWRALFQSILSIDEHRVLIRC